MRIRSETFHWQIAKLSGFGRVFFWEQVVDMSKLLYRLSDTPIKLPEWLINGVAEQASLWCDFGALGSGKTFRGIDVSAYVALRHDSNSCPVARSGTVIYVAGEGHAGIRRRFRAWEIRHQASLEHAPIFISSRPVLFGNVTETNLLAGRDRGDCRCRRRYAAAN